MPQVLIKETDLTIPNNELGSKAIIYIPGFSKKEDCPTTPQLCETRSQFYRLFGNEAKSWEGVDSKTEYDLSFIMADELLGLGAKVLYEVVNIESATGTTDVDKIKNVLTSSNHWKKLKDRVLYNIRFLTMGGYPVSQLDDNKEMVDCAKARSCVACITHDNSRVDLSTVEALEAEYVGATNIHSSNANAFEPWCNFDFTTDKKGFVARAGIRTINLPATFGYLAAYTLSTKTYAEWLPVAGVKRGIIPYVVKPLIDFGEADINILQPSDYEDDIVKVAVNPICNIEPFGTVIWGNRTLYENVKGKPIYEEDEYTTSSYEGLVASSFLNIRQLVSVLSEKVYEVSKELTFDINNDILWANFKNLLSSTLEAMVVGNGISNYSIAKVPTETRATLKARITIVPLEGVENFVVYINLGDALAEVNVEETEVASLV